MTCKVRAIMLPSFPLWLIFYHPPLLSTLANLPPSASETSKHAVRGNSAVVLAFA